MEDTDHIVSEINLEDDPENPRSPRRIIHFSSGETMEEYSTDEDDDELKDRQRVDTSKLSWGPYLQFWALRLVTSSYFTCEFLGGKLASLFGLTVSKYQYAVDEHRRRQVQGSEDEDGHAIELSEIPQRMTEKRPLESQGTEYGSIPLADPPVQPLPSSVITIDETVGPSPDNQSCSLNATN